MSYSAKLIECVSQLDDGDKRKSGHPALYPAYHSNWNPGCFPSCIFANTEVMSYKGTSTKVHIVPCDVRSSEISSSYVGDGRGSMGRSEQMSRITEGFPSLEGRSAYIFLRSDPRPTTHELRAEGGDPSSIYCFCLCSRHCLHDPESLLSTLATGPTPTAKALACALVLALGLALGLALAAATIAPASNSIIRCHASACSIEYGYYTRLVPGPYQRTKGPYHRAKGPGTHERPHHTGPNTRLLVTRAFQRRAYWGAGLPDTQMS